MNTLIIPPSPNWFLTKVAVCASDNTLVYGANNSIVIINPAPYDRPANVVVLPYAHMDRVLSVALSPTWDAGHKLVASLAADKVVKVWNLEDNSCIYSHKAHTTSKMLPVGIAFMSDTKIVSVSMDGLIVVWQMTTNEFKSHKNLLGFKPQVTTLATCPHAGSLTAFGLKSGLVIIYDFKRASPHLVYKLKNHDKEVLDLAWCPQPINVIPDKVRKPRKKHNSQGSPVRSSSSKADETEHVGQTPAVEAPEPVSAADTIDALPVNETQIQTTINVQEEIPQVETSTKSTTKKNPWVDLQFPDDDEMKEDPSEKPPAKEVLDKTDDFLSECLALKAKITEINEAEADIDTTLDESDITPVKEERKKLKPVKKLEEKPTEPMETISDVPQEALTSVEMSSTLEASIDVISDAAENTSTTATETEEIVVNTAKTAKPDYLLASSCRGGGIAICCAGTDGHKVKIMKLPKPKDGRYMRNHQNAFIALNWITPDTILSSGSFGELHTWCITEDNCKPKLIHNDHPRYLFCITSPFAYANVNANVAELAAWSFGQDRNIFYTTLKQRSILSCYPTFASGVQIFVASPIDPTRLALGLSEGYIRIWDLSKPHNQYIQMTQTKNKVASGKVTALAWHTSDEFLVAFGTEHGQVGFINSGQYSKPPSYFVQHFLTTIYKIEWGPIPGQEKHGLYVCANGSMGVYNLGNLLLAPTIIPTPKGERITHFTWKSDFSKIAVGCKNGTVYILSPKYEVQSVLYYQAKAITGMAWHPMQTAEDEDISKHHDWLACATSSSDNTTAIFDLSRISGDAVVLKDVLIGEFAGHVKPVNDIFWSPYKNGQLTTVSEDGTAIVWSDMKPVSTFVNQNTEPLFSGIWSPLDENYIITSGKDCSVRIWNLNDHPIKVQKEIDQERSARKKQLAHFYESNDGEVVDNVKAVRRAPLLGELAARQTKLENAVADCRLLFDSIAQKSPSSSNSTLRLFGDPMAIGTLIDEQKEANLARGKFGLHHHLALWKGDIGDVIRRAIKEATLTPWMLGIAPMISFKLWQEAVEAYAAQLAEAASADPIEIASYYLAQHRENEAIDALRSRQMHREALALAKFKRPDDTALHRGIVEEWAQNCIATGRFEIAAQCYVSLGEFEEAAKLLYKRSDVESLTLAQELAQHVGNTAFADAIKFRQEAKLAETDVVNQVTNLVPLPTRLELELQRVQIADDDDADGEHRKRKRGEKMHLVNKTDGGEKAEEDDIGASDSTTDNGGIELVGKKAKDIVSGDEGESGDTVDSKESSEPTSTSTSMSQEGKTGYDSDNKDNGDIVTSDKKAE